MIRYDACGQLSVPGVIRKQVDQVQMPAVVIVSTIKKTRAQIPPGPFNYPSESFILKERTTRDRQVIGQAISAAQDAVRQTKGVPQQTLDAQSTAICQIIHSATWANQTDIGVAYPPS